MSRQSPDNKRQPMGKRLDVAKVPRPSARITPKRGDGKDMRKGK